MKKTFCIIVTIISILLTLVYAEGKVLNDTQKNDLYTLGIMVGDENGDLRLNDAITRAEAIKIICTAGSISADIAEENPFPDVSENHWAYKLICAAKANGIIDGDEKGNFNPEATITNEEMVKILVCLLGYDAYAEPNGGYPVGYMAAGTRFGITTGLQLDINTPAIRNDVGIMICNALDIPLMTAKSPDAEGTVEYVIEKVTLRDKLINQK